MLGSEEGASLGEQEEAVADDREGLDAVFADMGEELNRGAAWLLLLPLPLLARPSLTRKRAVLA